MIDPRREAELFSRKCVTSSKKPRTVGASRRWSSNGSGFKLGMQAAQRQQQQQASLRYRQQLIDEIGRTIRPPQPPEPTVIYWTGRLGYRDFDPALMAQPLRWW
jgi:hypothetical protein